MTTDALVTEITPEMHRRSSQIGAYTLAREAFWVAFDECLSDLVGKCEDLAHRYCPQLWDQYTEGLITASEFLNKLTDEMSYENGKPMPPIDCLAAQGLMQRMNNACRKFSKRIKPIRDQLVSETKTWTPAWTATDHPYLFCHAIGSRLCDLDGNNKT